MVILENIDIDIDIDKAILQNIDIDKISNRFKFGISNRARPGEIFVYSQFQEVKSKKAREKVRRREKDEGEEVRSPGGREGGGWRG